MEVIIANIGDTADIVNTIKPLYNFKAAELYMNIPLSVNQTELLDVLLNVAVTRPVFIWGAPGIGKSSIVENFAASLGLPCVSMLGSQLAPIVYS